MFDASSDALFPTLHQSSLEAGCHVELNPSRSPEQEEEGFRPFTIGFRLEGMQGNMVAHVGHAFEGGRHCALVALVCSEAFPEGLLDGAVFHWAVASREGGTWSPPPDGWHSDPSRSDTAGVLLMVCQYLQHVSVCIVEGMPSPSRCALCTG